MWIVDKAARQAQEVAQVPDLVIQGEERVFFEGNCSGKKWRVNGKVERERRL